MAGESPGPTRSGWRSGAAGRRAPGLERACAGCDVKSVCAGVTGLCLIPIKSTGMYRGARVGRPAAIHLLKCKRVRPVLSKKGIAGAQEVVSVYPQTPRPRLDPVLRRVEARRADPNRLAARQHKRTQRVRLRLKGIDRVAVTPQVRQGPRRVLCHRLAQQEPPHATQHQHPNDRRSVRHKRNRSGGTRRT